MTHFDEHAQQVFDAWRLTHDNILLVELSRTHLDEHVMGYIICDAGKLPIKGSCFVRIVDRHIMETQHDHAQH